MVIDTREQQPYWDVRTIRTALVVGDYTTLKLWGKFHIERKSLEDLCGTITKGHLRFKKELIRAKHHGIKLLLVVDGTKDNFLHKKFKRGMERKIEGETLVKIIDATCKNHHLEIIWCKGRKAAIRAIIKRVVQEQKLILLSGN